MKYIIMCGGEYPQWETPRQLTKVGNETLIERTIRLLRANGINDIAITTNNSKFDFLNISIIHHKNSFVCGRSGKWIDAFYLIDEPVCYLFGDVLFSENAIKIIINTNTDDIEFFASSPPFDKNYIKRWAEPFAFKVQNIKRFKECIEKFNYYESKGLFNRKPAISWELWQVIKSTQLNYIHYDNYTVINDYTCDIDSPADIGKFRSIGAF